MKTKRVTRGHLPCMQKTMTPLLQKNPCHSDVCKAAKVYSVAYLLKEGLPIAKRLTPLQKVETDVIRTVQLQSATVRFGIQHQNNIKNVNVPK